MLTRRNFLAASAASGLPFVLAPLGVARGESAETDLLSSVGEGGKLGEMIHAPADAALWPAWREQLDRWREQARRALRYDDALYRRPDFGWARTNFACCFVMLCDQAFYELPSGRFTIESFLDAGEAQFGGYDSLVFWHAYPRIGFDERNQFDFYRDMPGGLSALRRVSRTCHERGVRVFVDYNPWDTGTRREGVADVDALAKFIGAIEADGIFLDTMRTGAQEFRAKLDAVRPGVVLEGELALPLENIHDHHASWAQWFLDRAAPGVLRNKWFERRHLQHQIKRWDRDHTGELHSAWMNGSGIMIWENVFGSWVGWNERDCSILRTMVAIQRRYAKLFCGEGWTPLVPTSKPDVYASEWAGPGLRLWTLVNRSREERRGPFLELQRKPGELVFDLIGGQELSSEADCGVELVIAPRGLGCLLVAAADVVGEDFQGFLAHQRALHARYCSSVDFPERPVKLLSVPKTARARTTPEGMVEVPAATFTMQVEFRIRECGLYNSSPSPEPFWGDLHQPKLLSRDVKIERFAIDLTPVTNAQFAEFLRAGGYEPKHRENYLKHWRDGSPPPGLEEHPVVHVGLEDARAYAAWAGKRLPTEEEWQYAAGGTEQRRYPWGDRMRAGTCNDGSTRATTRVTEFPAGRSPFGCYDMCGNVWHWTETEGTDGRTRFCILKGGSWFKAVGSDWYADGGPLPCRFAAKYLLMWPGLDRCSTIGFRCVIDLD